MSKTRYKIKKEQLERVVESFVTESASPEAKKHVQGYNDKEDESLGMKDGKKSTKKVSEKGRRADSKGKWGSRLKHASEAKKHKMSMGAEQSSDMGQGMKKASQSSSSKMKHAPEAKKHVKGSVSEAKFKKLQKFMLENNITENDLEEGLWGDVRGWATGHESGEARDEAVVNFNKQLDDMEQKAKTVGASFGRSDLEKKAKENNYKGQLKISTSKGDRNYGKKYVIYVPGISGLQSTAGGLASGMKGFQGPKSV